MDAMKDHGFNILDTIITKAFTHDGQMAMQRIVVASAIPALISIFWHYSRTVVEVSDGEQSRWVQYWLSQQHHAIRRARRLLLVTTGSMMGSRSPRSNRRSYGPYDGDINSNGDDDQDGDRFSPPKLVITPAAGVSTWSWYGWYPVSVERAQITSPSPYGGLLEISKYSLTVWFAPQGAEIAKKLILEGRQLWLEKRSTKTEILILDPDYRPVQFKVTTRPSRPLSSVIVEGDTKELILTDAIRFLQGETWYTCKGIPYRRGFLLHGPPGCGKTSLITALAGELRLPIVVVPLNSDNMSDSHLIEILSAAPRDSIVLIEDVDCALPKRSDEEGANKKIGVVHDGALYVSGRHNRNPVTLSGLLNAIDGVAAQEGRLLFMTTNHIECLDDALIRPGRVDVQCQLRNASKLAAGQLFDQFFNHSSSSLSAGEPKQELDIDLLGSSRSAFLDEVEDGLHSFAKLQGVLMKSRDEPGRAAEEMRKAISESIATTPVPPLGKDDGPNEELSIELERPEEESLPKN